VSFSIFCLPDSLLKCFLNLVGNLANKVSYLVQLLNKRI